MGKFAAIAVAASAVAPSNAAHNQGDRTITRVVKILQEMLEKSKSDGDEMKSLYAKFKCYCDTNTEDKNTAIADGEQEINLLGNDIEKLLAANGVLSEEVAKLETDIADNKAATDAAVALRAKEKQAYDDLKVDIDEAVAQMDNAMQALSEVGADQTSFGGADSKQFLANHDASFVSLSAVVKEALASATALADKKQARVLQSYLQSPFGTYTAQSGQIFGILTNMRDTFIQNLDTATVNEKKAVVAHDQFMQIQSQELSKMEESFEKKKATIGENAAELAAKKGMKDAAIKQKEADEEFLASLTEQCDVKAKQYDARTLARRNEEAALSEAISILNSDAAFATFGKVDATSSTAFLQVVQAHQQVDGRRDAAVRLLSGLSKKHVLPVLVMLESGNPFEDVLKEIANMIDTLDKEEAADKEKLDWCNDERTSNNKDLDEAKAEIEDLTSEIDGLVVLIDSPETGLRKQITDTQNSLAENQKAQEFNAEERKKENAAFKVDVGHLTEAEKIVANAITVLTKYYDTILKSESFLQRREDPAPPETWSGDYTGQSEKGGGAIDLLKTILQNTKDEHAAAVKAEEEAEADYSKEMDRLKIEEKDAQDTVARLENELATAEETLLQKRGDKKNTVGTKESLEKYLEDIKSGCDFITKNFDDRKSDRLKERDALEKAVDLLKETPAYKKAMAQQHDASMGECLDICKAAGESHVKCKACLAKTSVPGFCAGHADTEGC